MAPKRAASGVNNFMYVGFRVKGAGGSDEAHKRPRTSEALRASMNIKRPHWGSVNHYSTVTSHADGAGIANRWLICWESPAVNRNEQGPLLPSRAGQPRVRSVAAGT